jgi:lipopolysaccharide/colanic/teichoic acid biosynthesis glycosyltransferase
MRIIKRILQIVVAIIVLIVVSPVFLVSILLIVITTRNNPIYRGKRVGIGGKIFFMYKLMTLRPGAEGSIKARLLREGDPYITPVGGILRKLKIDELPQLLNVIKGDMNFIGPRPIRPIFYDYFLESLPHFGDKFTIKPGLTGLAQVMGDYQTPVIDKLCYEIFYNTHKNIFLDLKIIVLTIKLLIENIFARAKKL